MSLSWDVVGFRPKDEKWHKMKKVWDVCKIAGVDAPEDVQKFFDYEEPDDTGITVCVSDATKDYEGDMESGLEVELSKLPDNITVIRFIIS